MRKLKNDKNQRVCLLEKDMLAFYKATTAYLQKKLSLKNKLLQNIKCLQLSAKQDPLSHKILAVAAVLPKMSTDVSYLDEPSTEWRLYQAESQPIGDETEYVKLAAVVKSALSLSHGQTDVKRGFSLNKMIVSEGRVCVKEKTIVSLRTVRGETLSVVSKM
jgi:hypothetical protein